MRGSVWTVVALLVGTAMVPAILDVDVSSDPTGQTALGLLTSVDVVIGLAAAIAAFAFVVALLTDSGF